MDNNNLELGKYVESDLLSIAEDEVEGGATPAILVKVSVVISGYISSNTCPTTACTRAC